MKLCDYYDNDKYDDKHNCYHSAYFFNLDNEVSYMMVLLWRSIVRLLIYPTPFWSSFILPLV
jgi:hypothetical protein